MSVVSFVRKSLKVTGNTWHNGRGVYECKVNGITFAELRARVDVCLVKWLAMGIVESVERDQSNSDIRITFTKEHSGEGWYRTASFKEANFEYARQYAVVF